MQHVSSLMWLRLNSRPSSPASGCSAAAAPSPSPRRPLRPKKSGSCCCGSNSQSLLSIRGRSPRPRAARLQSVAGTSPATVLGLPLAWVPISGSPLAWCNSCRLLCFQFSFLAPQVPSSALSPPRSTACIFARNSFCTTFPGSWPLDWCLRLAAQHRWTQRLQSWPSVLLSSGWSIGKRHAAPCVAVPERISSAPRPCLAAPSPRRLASLLPSALLLWIAAWPTSLGCCAPLHPCGAGLADLAANLQWHWRRKRDERCLAPLCTISSASARHSHGLSPCPLLASCWPNCRSCIGHCCVLVPGRPLHCYRSGSSARRLGRGIFGYGLPGLLLFPWPQAFGCRPLGRARPRRPARRKGGPSNLRPSASRAGAAALAKLWLSARLLQQLLRQGASAWRQSSRLLARSLTIGVQRLVSGCFVFSLARHQAVAVV